MEQVGFRPEVEASRRTDDILFNVRYLAANIVDRDSGLFLPQAEADVLEQNTTEISEADVHKHAAVVYQEFDSVLGQYKSLGAGTVEHSQKGRDAIDLNDLSNWFEYFRRDVETNREDKILTPEVREAMQLGGIKLDVSPSPTHHEADPDIAISYNYDDRTMVYLQALSPDGKTKMIKSYSLFDVPAPAWAAYINDVYQTNVEPTALAVMKFFNVLPVVHGSFDEILEAVLSGVRDYIDVAEQDSLDRQLEAFLTDKQQLARQVEFYANEKLAFQKELALSFGNVARPKLMETLRNVEDSIQPAILLELGKRYSQDGLLVDDFVAELLVKLNTVMTDNRAGLATHNERTVLRVASEIGLDHALHLAQTEQYIQQAVMANQDSQFMKSRNEQMLADANISCGGACAVDVVGLFSAETAQARDAGLKGKLYQSDELNKNSKCSCAKIRKANVISNGKDVVCVACGDFQVNGKRGSLKKTA